MFYRILFSLIALILILTSTSHSQLTPWLYWTFLPESQMAEIIGEASNNIPEVFRQEHPHIPWKRMIGLRNIVIHEYFGVDLTIIWEIITKNLGETKPAVVEVLKGFTLNERK